MTSEAVFLVALPLTGAVRAADSWSVSQSQLYGQREYGDDRKCSAIALTGLLSDQQHCMLQETTDHTQVVYGTVHKAHTHDPT